MKWVGAVGGHGRPPVTFHMSPGPGEGEPWGPLQEEPSRQKGNGAVGHCASLALKMARRPAWGVE